MKPDFLSELPIPRSLNEAKDLLAGPSTDASRLPRRSEGPVSYLDGSSLSRPLTMPRTRAYLIAVALFALLALAVGAWAATSGIDSVSHMRKAAAQDVSAELNRGVKLELPALSGYLGMDSETLGATLAEAGYTAIDMNAVGGSQTNAIDFVKLPSDVSVADATVMYAKGIASLSAPEAARLLSASWRITSEGPNVSDLHLKYADFSSKDIQAAIDNAIAAEGWQDSEMGDSGEDSVGNTFQSGTVAVDGQTIEWTVSACALSEVYANEGLPSNAVYVGIHATASE